MKMPTSCQNAYFGFGVWIQTCSAFNIFFQENKFNIKSIEKYTKTDFAK